MRYAVCSAGPRRISDIASSPMARARAAFKVGDDEVSIAKAARRFLAEQDRMEELVGRIFAGHLRSIVGALTVEGIIKERDRVAQEVKDGSHADPALALFASASPSAVVRSACAAASARIRTACASASASVVFR